MRIATVTLNPAIDQIVQVNHFRPNTVNYGQAMSFEAGGKGINVASFLADAGIPVTVTGFLGQGNVHTFEQFFARKAIDDQCVRIDGNTRIGVKIVDEAGQQTTDINMPGLVPSPEAVETLFATVERLTTACDWFVLAGTLPPGLPSTTYATLIQQLKQHGKQIVLDTSRDALKAAIQAIPTIIKPNIDELQQLTGQVLNDERELEHVAHQLLETGIQLVIISMGERGALFVDAANTLLAIPPKVLVKSTVGAGDAMVAGLLVGKMRELDLADCARLSTAFSLGAITNTSHSLPALDSVEAYTQQVSIRHLI